MPEVNEVGNLRYLHGVDQIPLRRLCDKVWDKFPTKSQTCCRHKSWKSATQITSPTFMICARDKSKTLSGTCHGLCCKHLNMLRWFVSATFVICVHDFPCGKVSVKVSVMEFGLTLA